MRKSKNAQVLTIYYLRLSSCSWHQTINLPIYDFFNEIFIYFLFSAKFLFWNQPTFSKSWRCLKLHFTTSLKNHNTKFRWKNIRGLVKINLWFDVTNKILLFYALNLWKKKVCETIERCKKKYRVLKWDAFSWLCMNKISWSFHEGGNMGIERESVWKHGKTLLIGSILSLLTVSMSILFDKLPGPGYLFWDPVFCYVKSDAHYFKPISNHDCDFIINCSLNSYVILQICHAKTFKKR